MPNKKGKLFFEVSANLQKLVGEELVTNEEMALIELLKNAYDSGAYKVVITIQPETVREPGFIEIRDDGPGMSLPEFQRIYMFAGYSERDLQILATTRVPTGEKGIGRFAADRLGSKLDIITKTADSPNALKVSFDWSKFRDKKKKFGDIQIPFEYVERPDLAGDKSGTLLEIRRLRAQWKRQKVESVRRAIGALIDPYERPGDFTIQLNLPSMPELSGPIKQSPPIDPDYELRFKVSTDGKHLLRRLNTPTTKSKEWEPVPTGATLSNLPGLGGRLLYYVKRPSKRAPKDLPVGIQIYRDGFRLQPFGAPLEPWLQLTERRAKRAGHAPLVPNRLFGFVEVSRASQPGIKDTTSRQGLMETEDFHEMVKILKEQTDFIEEQLRQQVSIPNWRESTRQRSIEIERYKSQSLGDLSIGIAHEIRQPLQSIVSEAGAIAEKLEQLGIQDAELKESLQVIDDDIRRIDETIDTIQDLAKGDLRAVGECDLAEVVRKTGRLFSTQAKTAGILIKYSVPASQTATTSKNTVERVLVNLLKNAIEAIQEKRDHGEGEIEIELRRDQRTHTLTVSDNGGGIPKEIVADILKTFKTKKTRGLGFGLSHSRTIIQAHMGDITFETEEGVGTKFIVSLPDILG
jgi:signal transduction histidine kinase